MSAASCPFSVGRAPLRANRCCTGFPAGSGGAEIIALVPGERFRVCRRSCRLLRADGQHSSPTTALVPSADALMHHGIRVPTSNT